MAIRHKSVTNLSQNYDGIRILSQICDGSNVSSLFCDRFVTDL